MKKKLLATLLVGVLALSTFGLMACGDGPAATPEEPVADETADDPVVEEDEADEPTPPEEIGDRLTINLWSFTDEVPNMVARYKELNPEFAARYYVNVTIISTTDGAYQPALDQALVAGGSDAPDIFTAEAAFVLKYTQGDMASFAMPYADLGIDVDALIASSEIAPYTVEIGTRDGQVVGLGFQATGGALIYRRSIALDVFGTDDPDEVRELVGPGWNQFMSAAADMYEAGYAMVSGGGDLWQVIRNTGNQPWIVDGELYIDPLREEFMSLHRTLYQEGFMNDTTAWSDAWFADMSGSGEREVFSFLGPAWLINYVMAHNAGDTYGDWAVTVPPAGFFWGGTWVIANAQGNPDVRGGVAELIEWITLDASDDGLQYHWANGTLFADNPTKDAVGSGAVMARSNGVIDFLGGQDMFDIFVPAGEYATGRVLTQFDETINNFFMDQSTEYATGNKTREEAIRDFKQMVADNLNVIVNFD
jgi:maltose-binding protein MalE